MSKKDIIYTKICLECGKEFTTSNNLKIFCSVKCKTSYHNYNQKFEKKVYNRICPVCRKSFSTTDRRKIYCNDKCGDKACKIREKEERRKIMDVTRKVCPTCGKVFKPNVHNQVFCCKRCLRKANYKEYKKSIMSEYEKTCPICGKHFTAIRRNTIYCSIKCGKKGLAIKNRDTLKKYKKQYREKNKEHISKHLKEYCKAHKEELKIKKREYIKNRSKKDPIFRMKALCRAMVRRCLKNKKKDRTQVILGYSPNDLKEYLESLFYGDMCWDVLNWDIHHVKPIDTFNFINEDGTDNYSAIREANVLNNLVPLFKEDHKKLSILYRSEGKWLSKEEIKQMFMGDR